MVSSFAWNELYGYIPNEGLLDNFTYKLTMISFAYSLMELFISKLKFPYIYLIVDNKSINLSVFIGNLLTLNQQKLR